MVTIRRRGWRGVHGSRGGRGAPCSATGGVPRPPAQGIRISVSVGVHTRPGGWGISKRDTLLRLWISLWVWRLCLWISFWPAGNPSVGCATRLVCVPVRKRKRVKRKRCPAWGRPVRPAALMLCGQPSLRGRQPDAQRTEPAGLAWTAGKLQLPPRFVNKMFTGGRSQVF